ncbi:MAG TPA: right-handed parallel beta-helix repeat-containing protein [Nitrolancea sp.]|nr:right-handed parallel beta-helix repeat-containing protein [Nitrolancea sp.]
MRKVGSTLLAVALVLGMALVFSAGPAAAATCSQVTTLKGQMTASVIATSDQVVTGDIDATGCDIGVFVGSGVSGVTVNATVHDANQYGVFNQGNVTVDQSEISNIGNHSGGVFAPNGGQTGLGVYFAFGSNASGAVTNSVIRAYQKGGVAVNGSGASATVTGNTIVGLSDVPFIAQNGIQFGYGASGVIHDNTIDGNWYTGADWSATGLLLFDVNASGVKTSQNHFMNNQVNLTMVEDNACSSMYGGFYENYGLCVF